MTEQNHPEDFYRLNKRKLKESAKDWVDKCPDIIEQICLYEPKDDLDEIDEDLAVDYVIVASVTHGPDSFDFYNWADNGCLHICNKLHRYYKNKPPVGFKRDWMWFNIESGENIEDYNFVKVNSGWVLYQRKRTRTRPPCIFLLEARQEVQVIYNYIKKNCGGLLKSPSELKHNLALKCFQSDKKNFKILTIKDLDDTEIYDVTSHSDRQIMGRILNKIVLRKNYISEGRQTLFERTQKLKKTA